MYEYSRAPTTFYRVEDANSCARRIEGAGIVALSKTKYTWNNGATVRLVKNHLNWRSRKRSPFISVYDNLERARHEARRRVRRNHRDVVIWEIKTTSRGKRRRGRKGMPRAEYRNLTNYAEKRGLDIPEVALNMSECEWLFLKSIPECMIVQSLGY
jgi:hypothetical protein